MSKEYNVYLENHVKNVLKARKWLISNLPLLDGKFSLINIIFHDISKYNEEEYDAYDNYFFGDNSDESIAEKFNRAWLHHIHNNPHHWQYWVIVGDKENGENTVLEMPFEYVVEMICDWWSFSWDKNNLTEIFSWYDEHKTRILLHENTRKMVEYILQQIKEKLESM